MATVVAPEDVDDIDIDASESNLRHDTLEQKRRNVRSFGPVPGGVGVEEDSPVPLPPDTHGLGETAEEHGHPLAGFHIHGPSQIRLTAYDIMRRAQKERVAVVEEGDPFISNPPPEKRRSKKVRSSGRRPGKSKIRGPAFGLRTDPATGTITGELGPSLTTNPKIRGQGFGLRTITGVPGLGAVLTGNPRDAQLLRAAAVAKKQDDIASSRTPQFVMIQGGANQDTKTGTTGDQTSVIAPVRMKDGKPIIGPAFGTFDPEPGIFLPMLNFAPGTQIGGTGAKKKKGRVSR